MIFYVKYWQDEAIDDKIYVGVDDENEEAWEVTEDEALKEIRITVSWDRLSDWEKNEVYRIWDDKFNPNPEILIPQIPEQNIFDSTFTRNNNYNMSFNVSGSSVEPVEWITYNES